MPLVLSLTPPSHLLAAAYGEGAYSCGVYQVGCTSGTTPGTNTGILPPDTSALLSEPSFLIPGSLLLAILIALITTTVARFIRKRKANKVE